LNAPLPHRKEATMQQFLFDRDWQQRLPFLVASKTQANASNTTSGVKPDSKPTTASNAKAVS
jgi:hypothetical protein